MANFPIIGRLMLVYFNLLSEFVKFLRLPIEVDAELVYSCYPLVHMMLSERVFNRSWTFSYGQCAETDIA